MYFSSRDVISIVTGHELFTEKKIDWSFIKTKQQVESGVVFYFLEINALTD